MIKQVVQFALSLTVIFLSISAHAAGKTFTIDPKTAEATFKGYYFGLSSFNGQFNDIRGTIFSDPENPGNDRVQISIDTCSVDMNDKALSLKVKSASFLDCTNFPKIIFGSSPLC
ncbi:YceI family protein [Kiloniella sp.]|uniref:YceI family protein n=1 Tax=Kiloniella sp. TaxID=1938587 RepID=UPI003B027B57